MEGEGGKSRDEHKVEGRTKGRRGSKKERTYAEFWKSLRSFIGLMLQLQG